MLLLSTSSLTGYWLHKIFLLAEKAGYDGIDLTVDFALHDTYNAEYIDSLIQITNIPIVSVSAPQKHLTKKQLEITMNLANELEVRMVNVHPPHRLEKEKDWFGSYLKTLQNKYHNMNVNIINAPPKTWLFFIAEYGDARPETIKKMTEHTALSIENIDTSSGVGLMKTLVLLGSTLDFVYLSDNEEETGKTGLFPGEGTMPLESLLIKLGEKEHPFQWVFSLQVKPEFLWAWNDEKVVKRLQEAQKYLYKYFKPKV